MLTPYNGRMRWDETEHPRNPHDGRFVEKATGWVGRLSDRIGLPSAKDLLQHDQSKSAVAFDYLAREFEGRYGHGGAMTVSSVQVHRLGGGPDPNPFSPLGHLSISGKISPTEGDDPGGGYFRVTASLSRREKESDPLVWSAYIDRMHVRGEIQGSGGGRELTARFLDWFRRSGFDEITVGPSEIGNYAWGAMGFDFADAESRRIAFGGAATLSLQRVRDWFDYNGPSYGLDGLDLTDAQIKKMISQYRRAASLAAAGLMSYQRLSQYGRKPGQGKDGWWAGKLGLLVGGVGGGAIKL